MANDLLLLETGGADNLLLETGDALLLESSTAEVLGYLLTCLPESLPILRAIVSY